MASLNADGDVATLLQTVSSVASSLNLNAVRNKSASRGERELVIAESVQAREVMLEALSTAFASVFHTHRTHTARTIVMYSSNYDYD